MYFSSLVLKISQHFPCVAAADNLTLNSSCNKVITTGSARVFRFSNNLPQDALPSEQTGFKGPSGALEVSDHRLTPGGGGEPRFLDSSPSPCIHERNFYGSNLISN